MRPRKRTGIEHAVQARALPRGRAGPVPFASGSEHSELTAAAVALLAATATSALLAVANPGLHALGQALHQRIVREHLARPRATGELATALARSASHAAAPACLALGASELAVELSCLLAGDGALAPQPAYFTRAAGATRRRPTCRAPGRAPGRTPRRARCALSTSQGLALATAPPHPGGLVRKGDRSVGARPLGEETAVVGAVASPSALAPLASGRAAARGTAACALASAPTRECLALAASAPDVGGLVLEPHGAVHRPYGIRSERPAVLVDQNSAHDRVLSWVGLL